MSIRYVNMELSDILAEFIGRDVAKHIAAPMCSLLITKEEAKVKYSDVMTELLKNCFEMEDGFPYPLATINFGYEATTNSYCVAFRCNFFDGICYVCRNRIMRRNGFVMGYDHHHQF
jgi:hypothetical protein